MKHLKRWMSYGLPTLRLDLIWLPTSFWLLFAIVLIVLGERSNTQYVARSFLGGVLPLTGGIMAAYAVLDDPALELQFATPRPAWSMLLERLGAILIVLAVAALTFQGLLAVLGIALLAFSESFLLGQLSWLAPSMAMIALGSAGGFALKQGTGGALLAGGIWFFQVILHTWMSEDPIARYLYLFMGIGSTIPSELHANQACLIGVAGLLLWASLALLKKQERYI